MAKARRKSNWEADIRAEVMKQVDALVIETLAEIFFGLDSWNHLRPFLFFFFDWIDFLGQESCADFGSMEIP